MSSQEVMITFLMSLPAGEQLILSQEAKSSFLKDPEALRSHYRIRIKNKQKMKEIGEKMIILERILDWVNKTFRNKKMIWILFPHHLDHRGIQ